MARRTQQPVREPRFQTGATYLFGVLTKNSDSREMRWRKQPVSRRGSYFLGLGCRTVSDFCERNPEGLGPERLTFFQVLGQGQSPLPFWEGSPIPRPAFQGVPNAGNGAGNGLSDGGMMPGPFDQSGGRTLPLSAYMDQHNGQPARGEGMDFLQERIRNAEISIMEKDATIQRLHAELSQAREAAARAEAQYKALVEQNIMRDRIEKEVMRHVEKYEKTQKSGIGLGDVFDLVQSFRQGQGGQGAQQGQPPAQENAPAAASSRQIEPTPGLANLLNGNGGNRGAAAGPTGPMGPGPHPSGVPPTDPGFAPVQEIP